jgi:hypothetical protein
MKNFALTLALICLTAFAPDNLAQCSPGGPYQQDNRFHDHVRNGVPSSTSCWTRSGNTLPIVASSSTCGFSANAWEFTGYAQQISQTFTIPTTDAYTSTNWSFDYLIDFIDPNNDAAWNKFEVRIYADGVLVASDYYDGGMADAYCSRRSFTFSSNMEGKSVEVLIKGSKVYSDTYIRVRGITLWQGPN